MGVMRAISLRNVFLAVSVEYFKPGVQFEKKVAAGGNLMLCGLERRYHDGFYIRTPAAPRRLEQCRSTAGKLVQS